MYEIQFPCESVTLREPLPREGLSPAKCIGIIGLPEAIQQLLVIYNLQYVFDLWTRLLWEAYQYNKKGDLRTNFVIPKSQNQTPLSLKIFCTISESQRVVRISFQNQIFLKHVIMQLLLSKTSYPGILARVKKNQAHDWIIVIQPKLCSVLVVLRRHDFACRAENRQSSATGNCPLGNAFYYAMADYCLCGG